MNTKELFDLHGRNAIVTGGSRGLGLQIAEALGEMGAKVALTARGVSGGTGSKSVGPGSKK